MSLQAIHFANNASKTNASLLGFIEGILADENLKQIEIEALRAKIENFLDQYPKTDVVAYDLIDLIEDIEIGVHDIVECLTSTRETLKKLPATGKGYHSKENYRIGFLQGIKSDGTICPKETMVYRRLFRECPQAACEDLSIDAYCGLSDDAVPAGFDARIHDACDVSGKIFVITGESNTTPRKLVVQAIEEAGGKVTSAVSQKTDGLILMENPSPHWTSTKAGGKLRKALELGTPLYSTKAVMA